MSGFTVMDAAIASGVASRAGSVPGRDALMRALRRAEGPLTLIIAAAGALGGVNRIYGHDAGDRMIAGAAARLAAAAPPRAAIFGLAGAKFALLSVSASPEAAHDLARDLADAMASATSGPSVDPRLGVAWAPDLSAGEEETLIAAALGALDRAKADGAEIEVSLLDDEAERDALGRARRALDAIRAGAASIALQPVVAAYSSGRVLFREALIRVSGPDGAPISAGDFMPELERLGMTEEVDVAVLALAFEALARDPSARVSVNLSGAAMTRRRWPEAFAALASAAPDCAARLIVEVTE